MKKNLNILIFCLLAFTGLQAQTDTVFWFVIPRITMDHPGSGNTYYPGGKPVYFRMASLGQTTVTISQPANSAFIPITVFFPKDTTISVNMSSYINSAVPSQSIENAPENMVLNKGILIHSDQNMITAYWDDDNYYNRDIWALKGKNALGTEFYCPFQNVETNGTGYSPERPYSKIDIVATENTRVWITPTKDLAGGHAAGVTFYVDLLKGQTYSCRALLQSAAGHLGGTHITSTKKIAVTTTDDSVKATTSYDTQGDQLIPTSIIGREYIIMRGLINLGAGCPITTTEGTASGEKAFIVATQAGTSITANGIALGTINAGQTLAYDIKNNSTYVVANRPVYIMHASGFGCETGGAVLPKIEGCTGSKSVSFVRSVSSPVVPFYLNILTTTVGKNSLFLEYTSGGTKYIKPFKSANFERVGTTDWWVLKNGKKQFDSIPQGVNARVYSGVNGDRFHLGVINGNKTTGCKYGYFSDYSEDRGTAVINNNSSDGYLGCYGDTIQLTASGGLQYAWTLGKAYNYLDDSTKANPRATPPPGIYNYQVEIKRPCYPDTIIVVYVEIAPQFLANFDIDKSSTCSPNNKIKFTNNSFGSNVNYDWFLENKVSPDTIVANKNPIYHTFPRNLTLNPKVYNVELKVRPNDYTQCIERTSKNITVYPELDAKFTQDKTSGCNPLKVRFTNTSTGDTAGVINGGWEWNFGDNNTSPKSSITHQFENLYNTTDTTYNIRLIGVSNYYCRDTATSIVTIRPYIKADYTVDTTRGCADFLVNIRNRSKGGIATYNWDFGDGSPTSSSSDALVQHTYINNGATALTRTLRLTVSNAGATCSDILTRTITVLPKVDATFTSNPPNPVFGCNPLTVNFTPGTNNAAVTYNWAFGDGATSGSTNPSHQFTNTLSSDKTFTTQLIVTSADLCSDTFQNNIVVRKYIDADFSINKVEGCSGFTSTITNLSGGGIQTYNWDYGDGVTASFPAALQPATLNHVYNNSTSSTVTYTLTLTVNNNSGCTLTKSATITVHPGVAALMSVDKTAGCNPLDVAFTNNTDMSKAASVKWEFGDGVSSTVEDLSHQYSHLLSSDQVYTARLIAYSASGTCIDTMTTNITVYSYIDAAFTANPVSGCSPLNVSITNSSAGGIGITQRTWKYGDNATDNQAAGSFTHLYINNQNNPATLNRTLKLILENSHSCKDSTERIIAVNPKPFASFTLDKAAGCSPDTVQFTNGSNTVASSYLWDFGDGTSSILPSPLKEFNNNTGSDTVYNVKLTVTSVNSCSDDTIVPVTVYPYVNADFTINAANICSHAPVNITNNSSPGAMHRFWDFNGDYVIDNEINTASFNQAFINPDTLQKIFNVRLIARNEHACFDSAIKTITVRPRVFASFSADKYNGCTPLTVDFTNLSNIKNDPVTVFNWNFGDGTSTNNKDTFHQFTNTTVEDIDFPVTLTVTSGVSSCMDDTTINITVYANLDADFNLQKNPTCSHESIAVSNNSLRGSKHTFAWDFDGNGTFETSNNSASFQYAFINTDTLAVDIWARLLATNGHACFKRDSVFLKINPQAQASFTATPLAGCQPLPVTFANTSNIANAPGTLFDWDFGGQGSANTKNTSFTFNNMSSIDSVFPVKLTITSQYSCEDDTTVDVTAYAFVNADFALSGTMGCPGDLITMNNNAPAGVTRTIWDFYDGNTLDDNSTPVYHAFANTTAANKIFRILQRVENSHGCFDTLSRPVTIHPLVTTSFTASVDTGCQPLAVAFTDASVNATEWHWDFGNGNTSVAQNPGQAFNNPDPLDKVFPVRLVTAWNGFCPDTVYDTITAFAFIDALVSLPDARVCSDIPLLIINNSPAGVTHSLWDFYNTGTKVEINNDSVFHYYSNTTTLPVNYRFKLTAKNNHACEDTVSSVVTIDPRVVSEFNALDPVLGCEPLTIRFQNLTSIAGSPGTTSLWNWGEGTSWSGIDTTHIFSNYQSRDTSYVVTLTTTSSYSCTHDTSMNVYPWARVKADFNVLGVTGICNDTRLSLDNTTVNGPGFHNYWDLTGDGSIDFDNTNRFITSTPYYNFKDTLSDSIRIMLIVQNQHACYDTLYDTIAVYPQVVADFDPDTNQGCQPLQVQMINKSNIVTFFGTKWNWDFGPGGQSNDANPSVILPNNFSNDTTYNIWLRVESRYHCIDSVTKPVTAFAYIQARFSPQPANQCSDAPIKINNNSLGGVANSSWFYDLPSQGYLTNNLDSFNYTYANTDTFVHTHSLKLRVKNNHECYDSVSSNITIYPRVTAAFNVSTDTGCQPLRVQFTNLSNLRYLPLTRYDWYFGDGNSTHSKNPLHWYNNISENDSTFNVQLITISEYLCKDTADTNVTAYSYILADFKLDKTGICSDDTLHIFNTTSGGVKHNYWDLDTNTIVYGEDNIAAISRVYTNTSIAPLPHKLRLVVKNNHQCFDTLVQGITIYPRVVTNFAANVTEGCQPLVVSFQNQTNIRDVPKTKFNWFFGDGGTSGIKHPVHTFNNLTSSDITYRVTLQTVSQYLCSDDTSMDITAYAYIKANFAIPVPEVCSDNFVYIRNDAPLGVTHSYWDYNGDGMDDEENNNSQVSYYYVNIDPTTRVDSVRQIVQNNHACYDTMFQPVTIFPKVVSDFEASDYEGCQPLDVTFTNTTNLLGVAGMKYTWDFGDGSTSPVTNPSYTFNNLRWTDTIFYVSLTATSANNCFDKATKPVTAYAFIEADFKTDKTELCSDFDVTITDACPPGVSYRYWTFGDGQDTTNARNSFKHTYINTGASQVPNNLRLIVNNSQNCIDTLTRTILVNPRVISNFNADVNAGCNPLTVTFINNSNSASTDYDWTFGDGGTSKLRAPAHIYSHTLSADKIYNVRLRAFSQYMCEAFDSLQITVYPYIKAGFGVPNTIICSGFPITIKDNSQGGITQCLWDYESDKVTDTITNALAGFQHTYFNNTLGPVDNKLKVTVLNHAGCRDSIPLTITVLPKVTAQFVFKDSKDAGCHPDTFTMINTSLNAKTYFWQFSDGSTSTSSSPAMIFNNFTDRDDSIHIKMTASSQNMCSDSVEDYVYINHKPKAAISLDDYISCPPFEATFNNTSITSKARYTWEMDYNTITRNDKSSVAHTFNNNTNDIQSFNVKLTATTDSGCMDVTSVSVSVYPKVTALFDTIKRQCNPVDTVITNRSVNATEFLWDFGDSTTSMQGSPSHLFFNNTESDKTFTIKLKAKSSYGCEDSINHDLIVFAAPRVSFFVNPSLQYYPESTYDFTDLTNPGPWTYDWDFADGQHLSTVGSVSHTYDYRVGAGPFRIYNVKLSASNGRCSDTAYQSLILYAPMPIASFDSSASGCSPVTVFFKNKTNYYINRATWGGNYLWDFADGTTSTQENPTHTFIMPGDYNVKLSAITEGGTAYDYKTVTVFSKPEVDFSVDPQLVMLNDDVTKYFNLTKGGDSTYFWDFGDDFYSTEKEPTHEYKALGTYSVKLVSVSKEGCADSLTKENIVRVISKGRIIFPNAFTPNISGAVSEYYDRSDGTNDIFYPYYEGVAEYRLEIYNRWGELIYVSTDPKKGWNGYYKGKLCKQDVYVYKAKGKFLNGRTFVKSGDITLLYRKNR